MSEKFFNGGIIEEMKKHFDNAKPDCGGEMYMTEDQFRTISKLLGKTDDEIDQALKELPILMFPELGDK